MSDDRALVDRVLGGEPRAFTELVRRHQRLVEHLVGRVVSNPADRADVCQEVFLAVHRHLGRFSFESQLATWIGRIAYNAALTHLRRAQAGIQFDPGPAHGDEETEDRLAGHADPDDAGPLGATDDAEARRIVQAAVATLPPEQRAAVTLYHLQGMTIEEVGAVLDCPPNTVKSHLFRARKALKDRLLAHHAPEALLT
jgi:RNA polymerase sigma-70 factor (ECF subfamily)